VTGEAQGLKKGVGGEKKDSVWEKEIEMANANTSHPFEKR